MADVQILKTTFDVSKNLAPARATADGQTGLPWANRDGALVTQDWKQALAMDGRVFMCQLGYQTTSVAGKALDDQQPQMAITLRTGAGVAMIPLAVHLYCEDTVSTAAELVVAGSTFDIGAGTSTDGSSLITNYIIGRKGSEAIYRYTYSGAGTAAANGTTYWEFYRTGALYDVAEDSMLEPELHWEPNVSPILVPPCTLYIFWGSAGSSTAYATAVWAEVPLNSVT